MLVIQIIGMLFGILMAYYTFIHFRRKQFSGIVFFLWECVWLGMVVTVLFPKILDPLVHAFRFARTLDLLVTAAIIVVITVSFFNYIAVIKNKRKLEDLVRKLAIEEKSNRRRHIKEKRK
jgi:hypothetical protein